jgi:NAD(P)-dependent dehydrogenase (short-subunit alcohol dehydrogenase family)
MFLMTQKYLNSIPADKKATIISLTTGAAYQVYPGLSAYGVSKLIVLQLTAFIAAENPNVKAYALHPGVVPTDMLVDSFAKFALDTPELVGGTSVWLATDAASFMNGRFVNSNWSVDDLVERKAEIEGSDVLKMNLQGKFGPEQFK